MISWLIVHKNLIYDKTFFYLSINNSLFILNLFASTVTKKAEDPYKTFVRDLQLFNS